MLQSPSFASIATLSMLYSFTYILVFESVHARWEIPPSHLYLSVK